MRLIDADELRDQIDNYPFTEYCDYSNVIDMIDDAPTVECEPDKGWISVKKRMPDDNGNYLVLNKGMIEIAPYDKEVAQEGYFPFGYEDRELDEIGNTLIDWIEISGVTHWMPLPEPPEPPKEKCDWIDDDSMENEDMIPDNELIIGW